MLCQKIGVGGVFDPSTLEISVGDNLLYSQYICVVNIEQTNYYLIISGGSCNSCRSSLVKLGVVGGVGGWGGGSVGGGGYGGGGGGSVLVEV